MLNLKNYTIVGDGGSCQHIVPALMKLGQEDQNGTASLCLHCEFQVSPGNRGWPCLKTSERKGKKEGGLYFHCGGQVLLWWHFVGCFVVGTTPVWVSESKESLSEPPTTTTFVSTVWQQSYVSHLIRAWEGVSKGRRGGKPPCSKPAVMGLMP